MGAPLTGLTPSEAEAFYLLGLEPGAGEADIRRAFRALVSRTHPDVAGEAGAEPTRALLASYQVALVCCRRTTGTEGPNTADGPHRRSSASPVWLIDQDTIALECSHEEAFARTLEVGQALGSITYLDREGELLEVLLRTKLGDTLSLVISFQGRSGWVEAFMSTEVLDTARHELPTTAQIAELVAHELSTRWYVDGRSASTAS